MTRNIFLFLGTFVAGALIALVVRAAVFKPHAGHEGHPATGGDYAPMVSNPLAPATTAAKTDAASPAPTATPSAADPHANHVAASATTPASKKPVNTVCAICGMTVDPTISTAEYQGQTIAFGCKMCPPKFKADPDRYGPLFLKNKSPKQ